MLVRKDNPVGIDWHIDKLQTVLYPKLKVLWGINNDTDLDCFSRVYRNQNNSGYVAELYTANKNYKEVYFNDKVSATLWFGVSPETKILANDNMMIANVHVVFFVNLSKIKPGTQRNDQEVRLDVQHLLDNLGAVHGFKLQREVTGIEKILDEYPSSRRDEGLRYKADQHPAHAFRFDIQLYYQPTQKIC